jgi:hypothetical protein
MFCYIISKMSRMKINYQSISILLLFLSLSCSHQRKLTKIKIELIDTVQKYWNAMINHDHDTIQKLQLEPKEKLPDFPQSSSFDLDIFSFKIESVLFDEDKLKATVVVSYNYRIPIIPEEFHNSLKSDWIYRKGKWFFNSPVIEKKAH